ncbi:NmrA family protein [Nemania sp. FL0916]|nr:NmrA family protein [Nemania sp. FL0916]
MATYFVSQATGHQSLATITHLLKTGAKIHALVRSLEKAKTIPILHDTGVTLFEGESVDPDAVYKAAQGCQGVFLNTVPIPGLEIPQARTIIEESQKAGIKSIVTSTVFCTGTPNFWDDDATKSIKVTDEVSLYDYFRSKQDVENLVRIAGFENWTVLRPGVIHIAYMMPHVMANFPKLHHNAELNHFCEPDARIAQTDCDDIGKYAAAAFQNPAKFSSESIELVSENMTQKEVTQTLARVTGRKVVSKQYGVEEYDPNVFGAAFHLWSNIRDFTEVMKKAEAAQAKFGIPFTSLEDALTRDREQVLECIPVILEN